MIAFVHIPKTAGSTLYRVLDRHYSRRHIYTIWRDGTLADFKHLDDARRAEIRLLRGHFGCGLCGFLPDDTRYFTLLREPLDRVLSYYYFVRRTPHHYSHTQVLSEGMSPADFFRSGIDFMVDNGQTRLLADLETGQEVGFGECTEEHLAAAKRNLRDRFAVVGLTEEFDRTLLLLKRAFGWRWLFYARQNVSTGRPRRPSPAALEAARAVNRLDSELYRYASRLFAAHIERLGPDFAAEVRAFRRLNRLLSPLIDLYWRGMGRLSPPPHTTPAGGP